MATTQKSTEPTGLARIFRGDKVLWITIATLAVISVLVVYSSTAKMAYDAWSERSTTKYLRDQLFVLGVSAIALLVTHRINSRRYNRWAFRSWLFFLGLTAAVYFIGHRTNGAARWISVFGFTFQPSEALKVATVMLLARQLAVRQKLMDKLRIVPSLNPRKWNTPEQRKIRQEGTIPILLPVLLSCIVIFPAHMSSTLLVFGVSWVMMLIGRVPMRELLKLLGLVMLAGGTVYLLGLGRSDTAGGRMSTWVAVWTEDRTKIRTDELSDTERAMVAIHNGGLTGKGAGQSEVRVEMIHPESDYAYAFFVEEYGLVMGVLLLMLYLWIFFRAILIFGRCGTAFPGLLTLGLGLMITTQALLHIFVTLNLIPETGQTLPLISHGGSSALLTAVAMGMMLSVSRQNEENSHDRPKAESIYEK